jgi:spermidine/putrescine transport system ATP-binding protein
VRFVAADASSVDGDLRVAVRPEAITVVASEVEAGRTSLPANAARGQLAGMSHLGDVIQYVVRTSELDVLVRTARHQAPKLNVGDHVSCIWPTDAVYFFPQVLKEIP